MLSGKNSGINEDRCRQVIFTFYSILYVTQASLHISNIYKTSHGMVAKVQTKYICEILEPGAQETGQETGYHHIILALF